MHNIRGENVNVCFQEALWLMKVSGVEMNSRNGAVKMLPEPVCITYENPMRRVLFSKKRDANPYFHFMEALWMLHGGRDVEFLSQFNSGISRYSDDGKVFHGAYGHRWIHYFGVNQLNLLAEELKRDPESRRAVLGMWDPEADMAIAIQGGKDVPCNTHAYFAIRPHGLDITVCNRSNDLVWGALGANAVHFAFLLEWMAWRIGTKVGHYHQITNNLHIYEQHWWMLTDPEVIAHNPEYPASSLPMVEQSISHRLFDIELDRFITRHEHREMDHYVIPFFQSIAKPMMLSWQARKRKLGTGLPQLEKMAGCDWQLTCAEWISRRELA